MIAVAALLLTAVAIVYLPKVLGGMPSSDSLKGSEETLLSLQSRQLKLEEQKAKKDAELEDLRAQCRRVLWQGRDKVLSQVLQNELQNIARRAQVNLRSMGSPKSREVSEGIRGVDVSVRIHGDIKEIGRFIDRVNGASPRFFWTTCTVRVLNQRDPDMLDLTGRIEALFAVGPSEQLIFGEDGS